MYSLSLHDSEHNNLMSATCRPIEIVESCTDQGAACLIDYHSLSAVVEFFSESEKAKIKPIIGCQFFSNDGFITLIAKNKNGYHNLIKILSRSHDSDLFNKGPKVTLDLVEEYSKDLICLTGGVNSQLAHEICKYDEVYYETDLDRVKSLLSTQKITLDRYKSIFKDDLFLEKLPELNNRFPFLKILSDIIVNLGNTYKIPVLNITHNHHINNYLDHLTILSMGAKVRIDQLYDFLKSNEIGYLIPQLELYNPSIPKEIVERCEQYSISSPANLPKFEWTNGLSEFEYLKEICREGYKRKRKNWGSEYIDRIKTELQVIEEANLSGYFLIVSDYIKWAKSQNILVNWGRGSVAGSLVAYLMDITEVDPIPYNLIFSRFYNQGRNKPGNIELPDIDTDFPSDDRDKVIEYIREKYGRNRVANVCTFGRMMGASILKEIFRVHNACSFAEANRITKDFPQESKIAGDLEEDEKESGTYSIIKWILENKSEVLQDYCQLVDDKLTGQYSSYFEQAIRMEGIIKNQGKHAAGIVISNSPLNNICPMIHDKTSDNKITGLDMDSLKKIGCVKFDILSTTILDKVQKMREFL